MPGVEELTGGDPAATVVENALRKARAVHGDPVLAADTADLELTTEWIMLHGELEIGTEAKPHTRKATITLTLDNDESIECSILTIYEAAGNEYIALLPLNEKGENEDGEVYIYRYHQENGTPILENIENDEEYEAASDGFDEWLDSLEYDELVEDEEEE